MASIPKEFLEELISRTDLVEIISPFVSLKRNGKNYTACCPFHDEKTASFTVSPHKRFYYCFGCGANGNAISFLMDHQRLSFIESVEQLASKASMSLPSQSQEEQAQQQQLYRDKKVLIQYMSKATDFFKNQLAQDSGQAARQYLSSRGFSPEISAKFLLGWAPDQWQHFLKTQDQSKHAQLERSGLAISKDNQRYYERFRGRLMFPIQNQQGQTVGFGGRVLDDTKPKYLNSPETPLFHKQMLLYGWHQFINSKQRASYAILVEGYTDVIALHQAGIEQALATLGTACSEHQLKTIFQQVNTLYFCFDGDTAGKQAAFKALNTVLPLMRDNRQIFFLLLPAGQDPHSLIQQQGPGAFATQMESAFALSEYLLNHLTENKSLSTVDDRTKLVSEAKPLFNKLPQGLYKNLILEALSERTNIKLEVLSSSLEVDAKQTLPQDTPSNQAKQQATKPQKSWRKPKDRFQPAPSRPNIDQLSLIDKLICCLLQDLSQGQGICLPQRVVQSNIKGVKLLNQLLKLINNSQDCSLAYLLGRWHNTAEGNHLAQLASQTPTLPTDQMLDEFKDALVSLELQAVEREIDQALNVPNPDASYLKKLLTDKAQLTQLREESSHNAETSVS